ncbi:SIR2 family protein [Eshraghiella crossota]|uniref:SIR2 family protein n=1 Tax=Eshraghiella crossota TaxID=45851 RepID=UPI003AB6C7B7
MGYREIIEEDNLDAIMERNVLYLDQIAGQMKQGDISVFAGAGLSVASGYVDWKKLLEPISKQLRLNANIDLTEIAQYYKNKYERQGLNSLVFNEFDKVPKNNENVNWLAKMPISEFWTTNYDDVIEQSVKKEGKNVQVIVKQEDFKYHKAGREVTIYKMHGDIDSPDDVVLTKEDYQNYDSTRGVFTKLLSVELIRRTFLFIGFSFNDPNMERILSIAKQSLKGKSPQTHYCFMRKIQLTDYLDEKNKLNHENIKKYIQDKNYQELRINAMAKYGILTILVNDYEEITLMLRYLYNNYITNNVFVSGGINPENLSDYGNFDMERDTNSNLGPAENFLTLLGKALIDNNFHIYTGFGAGVGNYILSGVLLSDKNKYTNTGIINNEIHISSLVEVDNLTKKRIREKMIGQCSSSIIVFGYGNEDSGTYGEYEIAEKAGKYIVPIKKTGFAAENIYEKLKKQEKIGEMVFLEEESKMNNMVQGIVRLLVEHKEKKENELREKMFSGIALSGIKVFISYHYQCDNKVAKEITNIVNKDRTSLFTVLQEQVKKNDSESIKRWVDEEIKKTRFTILLISKETFEREYVSYEITKSRENGNTIIPILIDNEENAFSEKDIETLSKKLPKTNCKRIRRWIKDCGKENVLQWLNDALGV